MKNYLGDAIFFGIFYVRMIITYGPYTPEFWDLYVIQQKGFHSNYLPCVCLFDLVNKKFSAVACASVFP